jgi:hypothetical protein
MKLILRAKMESTELCCTEEGKYTPHSWDWQERVFVCDVCGNIYDDFIPSSWEETVEMRRHINGK